MKETAEQKIFTNIEGLDSESARKIDEMMHNFIQIKGVSMGKTSKVTMYTIQTKIGRKDASFSITQADIPENSIIYQSFKNEEIEVESIPIPKKKTRGNKVDYASLALGGNK